MLPFWLVEPERPGDRVEHLCARVDRATLLQPGVPGDTHAGQHGHFLAAQASGPAPDPRRQPDVLRRDALSPAAEEGSQLSAASSPCVWCGHGHISILACLTQPCQVALVPG